MLDLIWNIFQDEDIRRLRADVANRDAPSDALRSKTGSIEGRLLELEQRHEQLKLTTLALWRLLKARLNLTDADLTRYVKSTDLLDGAADGKVDLTRELQKCSSCGRHRLNTSIVCPFCGARSTATGPFDVA